MIRPTPACVVCTALPEDPAPGISRRSPYHAIRAQRAVAVSATLSHAVALLLVVMPPLAAQQTAAERPGPGRIEGIVVDMWGRPVEGADVWLVNRAPRVRTGTDGAFALAQVPVGYQWARAHARGWHRASSRAHVTHDAPVQFVQIVVLPAADIDVRVVDAAGAPIAGADVSFSRTADPGAQWLERGVRYTTDANGELRLDDLALGNTVIHAVAPGFGVASTTCYVGDDAKVVVTLQRTEAFRLRLRLLGASAEQIVAARWHLYAAQDGYGAGCVLPPSLTGGGLDPDGTATIRGLPLDMEIGQISIQVPNAGVSPRDQTLLPAAAEKSLDHELSYTVVPRTEQAVRGVVLDPTGKPIAGLELTCNSHEVKKGPRHARTDEGGAFRFERVVAAGEAFSLQSLDPRWVFDQAKDEPLDAIRYRRLFEAQLAQDESWEVRCIAATEVHARVVGADGRGVPGIQIELTTKWDERRSIDLAWASTDREGLFTLPRLNGSEPRDMWIEASGRAGSATSARFRLEVGKQIRLPDLTLAPPGEVVGTVRDSQGRPVPGASVALRRTGDGSGGDEAVSDRDGRFRVVAGPGTYRLLCFTGHEKYGDRDKQNVELRSGQTLEVALVRERR